MRQELGFDSYDPPLTEQGCFKQLRINNQEFE